VKDLWIRRGRLLDPSQKLDMPEADVLIRDGKVQYVGKPMDKTAEGIPSIDAKGLLVCPGFIDLHVRLGEPGRTRRETIASGTLAAAAGGFTTVACPADTDPVNDSAFVSYFLNQKVKEEGKINVLPIGAITRGMNGEELAEMGSMWEAGVRAVSDSPRGVMNAYVLRKAMDYAKRFELLVISHAEDSNLRGKGVMNEGFHSAKFGLRGIPKAAEELMVARDILLCELTGARLHFAHISTAGALTWIRHAKQRGLPVTAETTPHHLWLTDEIVGTYDTNTKVLPPLREAADVHALRQAVEDGTIDSLSSDHCPQPLEDKQVEYDQAEFGISGLETAVGLYLKLVHDKHVSLHRVISAVTEGPARIMNIPKGSLKVGREGDVTLLDLKRAWTVDKARFQSRCKNTPFEGWDMPGQVVGTVVGGDVVFGGTSFDPKERLVR
jgi:dihydroorotase